MSVRSVLLPSLLALVLGAGAAGLVACGDDSGGERLLASTDAEELLDDLSTARDALAGGECTRAARAVARARRTAADLPSRVDRRLRERLNDGLDALETEIGPDCEEQTQTETIETTTEPLPETTETETEPVTPTETDTAPTPTEPAQPTNPETQPPAQTTPPEVPPGDEPEDTGGVSPDQTGGD